VTGLQLQRVRTARQWTQAELAARLGVSQGYVCLIERGARPVPTPLAETLARVLDMLRAPDVDARVVEGLVLVRRGRL